MPTFAECARSIIDSANVSFRLIYMNCLCRAKFVLFAHLIFIIWCQDKRQELQASDAREFIECRLSCLSCRFWQECLFDLQSGSLFACIDQALPVFTTVTLILTSL